MALSSSYTNYCQSREWNPVHHQIIWIPMKIQGCPHNLLLPVEGGLFHHIYCCLTCWESTSDDRCQFLYWQVWSCPTSEAQTRVFLGPVPQPAALASSSKGNNSVFSPSSTPPSLSSVGMGCMVTQLSERALHFSPALLWGTAYLQTILTAIFFVHSGLIRFSQSSATKFRAPPQFATLGFLPFCPLNGW